MLPKFTTRRLLANPDEEQTVVEILRQQLPTIQDVTIIEPNCPIQVERKRNLLKNRNKMKGEIDVLGGDLTIEITGLGSMQSAFASEILNLLPPELLDDQGLSNAIDEMTQKEQRWFGAAALRSLDLGLLPGEHIDILVVCLFQKKLSVAAVTNLRLIIQSKVPAGRSTFGFAIENVTNVSAEKNSGNTTLIVSISENDISLVNIDANRATALARCIQEMRALSVAEITVDDGAHDQAPTTSDELEKLSNLYSNGLLTDSEFATAKAKLLGL